MGAAGCTKACAAGGGRADACGTSRPRRYFREGFQRATADLVERELQRFERPEEIEIFFSAHGVPVSYVEQVRLRARSLRRINNKHMRIGGAKTGSDAACGRVLTAERESGVRCGMALAACVFWASASVAHPCLECARRRPLAHTAVRVSRGVG